MDIWQHLNMQSKKAKEKADLLYLSFNFLFTLSLYGSFPHHTCRESFPLFFIHIRLFCPLSGQKLVSNWSSTGLGLCTLSWLLHKKQEAVSVHKKKVLQIWEDPMTCKTDLQSSVLMRPRVNWIIIKFKEKTLMPCHKHLLSSDHQAKCLHVCMLWHKSPLTAAPICMHVHLLYTLCV